MIILVSVRIIIIIIITYYLKVFHISFSWWFLTEVWETESLIKSPVLLL